MAARKTQALSLLEGILDETATEAEAARLALDAEIRRKEQETRLEAEAQEAERRAEIARRLQEEEVRQHAAADRRTAALEAIRVEELKAKGLWKEPEPEPEPAPVVVKAPVAQTAPVVEEKSRGGFYAAAAALLVLGAGAAGGYLYMTQEFVDSTTSYAAAQPSVVALADAQAMVAFTAIPDPIIVEAEAEPERRRPRSSSSSSSSRSEPERRPRSLDLGGNMGGGN